MMSLTILFQFGKCLPRVHEVDPHNTSSAWLEVDPHCVPSLVPSVQGPLACLASSLHASPLPESILMVLAQGWVLDQLHGARV